MLHSLTVSQDHSFTAGNEGFGLCCTVSQDHSFTAGNEGFGLCCTVSQDHSLTASQAGTGVVDCAAQGHSVTGSQWIFAVCRGEGGGCGRSGCGGRRRLRGRRGTGRGLAGDRKALVGTGHGGHGFQQDADDGGEGCVALRGPHAHAPVEILVDDDGDVSLFHGGSLAGRQRQGGPWNQIARTTEERAARLELAVPGSKALLLLLLFAGKESAKLRKVFGEWNEGFVGG